MIICGYLWVTQYLTEGGEAGLDATAGQLHAQLVEGSGHHFLLLLADCLYKKCNFINSLIYSSQYLTSAVCHCVCLIKLHLKIHIVCRASNCLYIQTFC